MTTEAVLLAARFAARAHHGQTRKGADGLPYVDHVLEVAARLAAVHPDDELLIVAGLLHDTVEDCDVTREDIAAAFGEEVAALVMEVTDDTSLPRAERKAAQERHVPHASDRAKRLKLADKAANLSAIARTPPDWDAARMTEYVDWACRVLDPVRGLDAQLEGAFDAAVAEARAAIAARS
ncbi:HD domain-containing protein [Jannaschia seohaensis]|uniref:HD domain-containing protein n=1 Tax=Jannaschia seohaensis TaxID=475081 RepID=A0A2Y9AYG0_9RHOB|nr:HD domain-containing protein [Jannaschia seohaensis]PWJ16167.1 HD domain-containing protein [Jannaschia seohaensis]SSA49166.1 HD domain-containing protein [Jannaschia seohaensis]